MSLDVNISEPEEFNCTELHSCVKEVANMKGIEDFEYHVDYIQGKGQNYIANIFRVLINERGCSDYDNVVSVIVKTLLNTTRQELFHELHIREVTVYEEVICNFISIQNELDENKRIILPKYLYSRIEKGNDILILEDMLVKGFEINEKLVKFEKLDYNQVSLVLSELAKFHALSLVYETRRPESFKEVKSKMQDIIFQEKFLNKSKLRSYFTDSFSMSLRELTDLNAKKKLEIVETKLIHILRKYMQPRKYNVLCHGDCWINNILFKTEENQQSQICFLDFQAMRYTSPVADILYFLYICTDTDFRSEYLEDLQNVYYDSLKTFLLLYDIDVNEMYPREEFKHDIIEYLPFGLIMALLELKLTTITPQDEAILKEHGIVPGLDCTEVPGKVDLLKIRLNEVVKESLENGCLDRLIKTINI